MYVGLKLDKYEYLSTEPILSLKNKVQVIKNGPKPVFFNQINI